MTNRVTRLADVSLVLCLAASAIGCSVAVSPKAMVPPTVPIKTKHASSVSIQVTGGRATDELGRSQIPSEDFREALGQGIRESGFFSSVDPGDKGTYLLHVHILNLEQPTFGGSFTVKMEAAWRLVRMDSSKVVFEESIKSEHTVTMGDAFFGPKRLTLATEGAARENIRLGIEKLARVDLE